MGVNPVELEGLNGEVNGNPVRNGASSKTRGRKAEASGTGKGLEFRRVLSTEGIKPYDRIQWSKRSAVISNERGEVVFEQNDVEVPDFWSQMATNVVVSKYFRGTLGTSERESSVRQLVSRVADTITNWGRKDGYFKDERNAQIFNDELTTILVEQYGAFNSPVWFNVGVEKQPQCSACFILAVDDTMESLLDLQRAEGMLFKYGSGAGSNLSNIRSSKERLSGGGTPSGPVSFMRGFDSWAGTIKSGGKTRRAAKMQILDVEHPDIREFVNAKRTEEQKAWALIEAGYPGGFNVPGGAYDSVFFQNSNFSVRVTDEFMKALEEGRKFSTRARVDGRVIEEIDPRELMREIALGTHVCGDPGLQFDTIINKWHTTPKSGRINASNPCSEYMHLDDSACNLASINLMKFLRDDGSYDVDGLKHVAEIFITAQDITVDNASYPTEKIGKNARAFRQLGLGFANIGALLMSEGIAYDSDEGRNVAAALMGIVCGQGYLQSARIAEAMGPFAGYKKNEREMINVIAMHTEAADKLPKIMVLDSLRTAAQESWHAALRHGKVHGYRNSQATVLAPTGTIAFLMDCDTTGIEPDIALVKYKKLVGGGMLKIVNNSVPRALRKLGYNDVEVDKIIAFINENDTIEGAPGFKDEHLSIFDCAFKPMKGTRSIHYMGHVKMMAAAQPFVSGAISKTVNLPEQATVEDIYNTYVEAWKLGLKAVAIYRDNSKRSQPLATSKDEGTKAASAEGRIARRHLPDERNAITHKFNIAGHEGYFTVGLYEDGAPGEIFIVMAKEGSTLSGVMDAFATSISMALQYGVPLEALVKKFSHMRFEPSGFTQNKDIPMAKSIMDYIFRWMALKFMDPSLRRSIGVVSASENAAAYAVKDEEDENEQFAAPKAKSEPVATTKAIGFNTTSAAPKAVMKNGNGHVSGKSKSETLAVGFQIADDAPPCTTCGSSLMVRQGACYRCLNCGSQGGCG